MAICIVIGYSDLVGTSPVLLYWFGNFVTLAVPNSAIKFCVGMSSRVGQVVGQFL